MSEKPRNMDEQDDFSRLIKEKLENYQLPVDESVWKGIEQKMTPPRKRIIPPVWYWISGGAAAAISLLLILKPLSNNETAPVVSETMHSVMKTIDSVGSKRISKPFGTALTIPAHQEKGNLAENRPSSGTKTPVSSGSASKAEITVKKNVSDLITQPENATSRVTVDDTKEAGKVNTDEVTSQTGKETEATAITSLPDLNDYPDVPVRTGKTKKKRPLLLAAAFGTVGNLNAPGKENPMNTYYTGNLNLVRSEIVSNYAMVLNANEYSEARHLPPLSVGVTVVKPLNDIFSLESGLVYTYLKSEYFRPGLTDAKGVLQLHYLGVPLNLRAKLLNKPGWDVYFSAGGMVEKGLRAIYNQQTEGEFVTTNTDVRSGIDGVQWSVDGAMGIDYKIRKELSLFLEPKLIYYLQNNQPQSARTEQPLNFGINGGLRIEL
ncbi:MAG: outer membrane beta-barrel protein [Paludibacteraceae bacterium]